MFHYKYEDVFILSSFAFAALFPRADTIAQPGLCLPLVADSLRAEDLQVEGLTTLVLSQPKHFQVVSE